MKIMLFNKENKWVEVENGLDFDTFYNNVILGERPFKFTDCSNDEEQHFLEYLADEAGGLDDCDYYRFNVNDDSSVDNIFIFDDLKLYTLDDVIHEYEQTFNYYKSLKNYM